jgi:alkylhydroperoxidase/carboxymuconolactone decarboxylase family protein YurZ
MNERIKELVVESGNGQFHNGKFYPHIGSRTAKDWEKFAELIVRECTSLFDGTKEMKTVGMLTHNQVVEQIKKHFGVEE